MIPTSFSDTLTCACLSFLSSHEDSLDSIRESPNTDEFVACSPAESLDVFLCSRIICKDFEDLAWSDTLNCLLGLEEWLRTKQPHTV